jgi:hypothetical protein
MDTQEQRKWIADHPTVEAGLGVWEMLAELLGFDVEKSETEVFNAMGVTCYEELTESAQCSFLDSMEAEHIDHVEKHAPIIYDAIKY